MSLRFRPRRWEEDPAGPSAGSRSLRRAPSPPGYLNDQSQYSSRDVR